MNQFSSCRPAAEQRCFSSQAIENVIENMSRQIADAEVAWLFSNCFPNTLDTTVTFEDEQGKPDAFVITGDIDAMWLRDSTNQVWPYLPFVNDDPQLNKLIQGLINRQAACVRLDPYANAFYRDAVLGGHQTDITDMKPGTHERKYELDSLCAVLRLAHGYYEISGDASCFDDEWLSTLDLILQTIRNEQAGIGEGEPFYRFERISGNPIETLALGGQGHPARRCGLSKSPFRPSDDAALLPFLVPANAMAVANLRGVAQMLQQIDVGASQAHQALALANEIEEGIAQHAIVEHPRHGRIYAYEIDGYGGHYLMDDANVPSLLSLAYLGFCPKDDDIYQNTRNFVLSADNPYYFEGKAGNGIGGPHVGLGSIWPMSIIMRALTSQYDDEIRACLSQLKATHAGTGFMHETFWKDDAQRFSRHWFAWANTLFGELILTLHKERPHLLQETFLIEYSCFCG